MKILSHRGYWKSPAEKNTPSAFARSASLGFGTETDLRDRDGGVVISHDPPDRGAELPTLAEFLATFAGAGPLPLALNIKADGLAGPVRDALDAAYPDGHDAFVFDMAVPDMRGYFAAGVPVFTRMSEVEPEPAFLDKAAGVWLDAFEGEWFDAGTIGRLLDAGKRVCVVSPELHRRDHRPLWERLIPLAGRDGLSLCTDLPEDAAATILDEATDDEN